MTRAIPIVVTGAVFFCFERKRIREKAKKWNSICSYCFNKTIAYFCDENYTIKIFNL